MTDVNEKKRKIAIIADIHGLLEPLEAVLFDIKQKGINEIYSLGDNIGYGPNPNEVLDLLCSYNVKSIMENYEEYLVLGTEPFSYLDSSRLAEILWTLKKLSVQNLNEIINYKHSYELILGRKKIALCHFVNDVRFDYIKNSTWSYQYNYKMDRRHAYRQFLNTNSVFQKKILNDLLNKYGRSCPDPKLAGYYSAIKEPLFSAKTVDNFDIIFQGHVHFEMFDDLFTTKFYSIRSLGMAYENDSVDMASYVLLQETACGYFYEKVLVKYDRDKMISSILNSDSPDTTIRHFVNLSDHEIKKSLK